MDSTSRQPDPGYKRLSGQDAAFLSFEGPGRPMHIGALAFVSAAEWRSTDGEFDSDRLKATIVERARAIPGLDRRLSRAPLTGWPIWVISNDIDWKAQVEVIDAVESEDELQSVAETAMATPLDRSRPLWRVLIIPRGDTADTFALMFLAHHALVDGIAGIDLLALLLDRAQVPSVPVAVAPLLRSRIVSDEIQRWTHLPILISRSALAATHDQRKRSRLFRRATAFIRTAIRLLSPGPKTLLHGKNEGSRSVAWFSIEERPLRLARRRLHGTPNDLVMAAVASAVDAMPGKRGPLHLRKLRAAVPVSFRTRKERYSLGNRLGLQLVPLDPVRGNLARSLNGIRRSTAIQKRRGDAEGYEVLTQMTAWTGQWSQRLLSWLAGRAHSYAILITNVPGPSRAYSLGGAPLEAIYPLVPLFASQSLSVAVVRYGGFMRVGVTSSWADPELVELFSSKLQEAFRRITFTAVEPVTAKAPKVLLPLPETNA